MNEQILTVMLIGNKHSIAIESAMTHMGSALGHACLWFGNEQLGSLEDLIYLDGYLLGCLLDMRKKPHLTARYQGKDDHQLFSTLNQDLESWDEDDDKDFSEEARPYLLTCGTLFDCYTVFSYRLDETHGRIMWQITCEEENTPFEDLRTASRDVHFATFDYTELASLISELQSVLEHGRLG